MKLLNLRKKFISFSRENLVIRRTATPKKKFICPIKVQKVLCASHPERLALAQAAFLMEMIPRLPEHMVSHFYHVPLISSMTK